MWPNWRPETELRARDLAGLEDYLLARGAIADDFLHGVESLNYRAALRLERNGGPSKVLLQQVMGVTPNGQPIIVEPADGCYAEIPDAGQGRTLDLFIQVAEVAPEARAQKQWLVIEPVPESGQPIGPGEHPGRLYLGRYSFDQATGAPTLVHYPMVRRFAAIQPPDELWQNWTKPLRTSLDDLEAEPRPPAGQDAADLLRALEVTRLRRLWAVLPVTQLRLQLQLIANLGSTDGEGASSLVSVAWPTLRNEIGQTLPSRLARILAPTPKDALALVLQEVLRPVTIRVPLWAFDSWQQYLENLSRFGATQETGFDDSIETVVEAALQHHALDEFIRVAALGTIWSVRNFGKPDWGERALPLYRSSGTETIESTIVAALDRILQDMATTNRRARPLGAKPLGLERVVKSLPAALVEQLNRIAVSDLLRNYFRAAIENNSRIRLEHPAVQHLITRLEDQEPPQEPIEPRPLFPRNAAARGPEVEDLRVVIAGDDGSGRASLQTSILKLLKGDTDVRLRGIEPRNALGAALPAIGSVRPDEVVIGRGGALSKIRVEIADLANVGTASLVILTVPPSAVESAQHELGTRMAAAINDQLARPNGLIAVAFTKADEYGVLSDPNRALTGFTLAALQTGGVQPERRWEALVTALRQPVTVVRRGRTPSLEIDPWCEPKIAGMEVVRGLFELLLQKTFQRRFSNAYMIAASPLDSYFKYPIRMGVSELLADWLHSV
jgi:hypothetical protein